MDPETDGNRLAALLERETTAAFGFMAATTRNWRTVGKLLEMAERAAMQGA